MALLNSIGVDEEGFREVLAVAGGERVRCTPRSFAVS